MKARHFFFPFALFALVISMGGCSKDTDDTPEPELAGPDVSGKLKLVWLTQPETGELEGSETYHYDAEGRLSEKKLFNSPDYTDEKALVITYCYTYTPNGQLESITSLQRTQPDNTLWTTEVISYVYQENGEIAHEHQTNLANNDRYIYYTYENGLVTKKDVYDSAERLWLTILYTYNKAGQLLAENSWSTEGEYLLKVVYTYENGLNTLEEQHRFPDIQSYSTRITRLYDSEKRLVKERFFFTDPGIKEVLNDRDYVYF